MAISSRDYLKAGKQRLTTAEFLLQSRYNLDAMYLAGYAVESSLKALIMEITPEPDRPAMFDRISHGEPMHYMENLAGILNNLGHPVPPEFRRRARRFGWATSLRYESGRVPTSEARGFLNLAGEVCDWGEGELP
jgi:HEPN domain-containing protein